MKTVLSVRKILSPNDVGETATHQAGMLIPKTGQVLDFFPALQKRIKNPRCTLTFIDKDGVTKWSFEFIYYNGKFFGGTRNEYRLTGMTAYVRSKNLKSGDAVELSKDGEGRLFISSRRRTQMKETEEGALILSPGWKVIRIRP
jgi:hypothetical protein